MATRQLCRGKKRKPTLGVGFREIFRGPDGTRTRDLRRDRAAF